MTQRRCHCRANKPYSDCCGPIHAGRRQARSASELLRSRYSAYVLHLEDYLLQSWHPDTRPDSLDFSRDETAWLKLKIERQEGGGLHDERGFVTFSARYRLGGREFVLRERGEFVRLRGRWVYLDGPLEVIEVLSASPVPLSAASQTY